MLHKDTNLHKYTQSKDTYQLGEARILSIDVY